MTSLLQGMMPGQDSMSVSSCPPVWNPDLVTKNMLKNSMIPETVLKMTLELIWVRHIFSWYNWENGHPSDSHSAEWWVEKNLMYKICKLEFTNGLFPQTLAKGQLNSEWIYEVIVSPKMQTKNFMDFCPTIQTRIVAFFLVIFGECRQFFLAAILICLVGQKSL